MTSDTNLAHALIQGRHSIRAFQPTPIGADVIGRILSTAAHAPSGTNMQPWRVYVLTGGARDALVEKVRAMRAAEPERERGPHPFGEYLYNPEPLQEPYRGRRKAVGWGLYSLLGIAPGDRAASWVAAGRNFEFFGAPVGLIFTLDRALGMGSWLDLGIFLQSVMLAARAEGLDTCCQAAWRHYHDIIRQVAPIDDQEIVICGMSLGQADETAIANTLRAARAPLEEFARFISTAPSAPSPSNPVEPCNATS